MTYVSQVEGDFQISRKFFSKFGVKIKNIEDVIPHDAMEITVGEGTHVARRFAYGWVEARVLPKYVIFPWKSRMNK